MSGSSRQRRVARRAATRASDDAPYVCPGCYATGEPCAPGCIDAEIEAEQRLLDERAWEEQRLGDDYEPPWPEDLR